MLKVELHTHTADDPVDTIPHTTRDLIDRAAALGYDAVAVTLHERQYDVALLAPYAAERGIVLIPGIERTVEGRHVLLLNFPPGTEAIRSFDDVARLKRQAPGLVIAPHPYYPSHRSLLGKLDAHAELFDAVEYNAMYTRWLNPFNQLAERWARRHGTPMVGNCDVHRLEQLGSTYSLVDAERNPASICEAIAAGRVEVVSQPLSWTKAARIMADLLLPSPGAPAPVRVAADGATGEARLS